MAVFMQFPLQTTRGRSSFRVSGSSAQDRSIPLKVGAHWRTIGARSVGAPLDSTKQIGDYRDVDVDHTGSRLDAAIERLDKASVRAERVKTEAALARAEGHAAAEQRNQEWGALVSDVFARLEAAHITPVPIKYWSANEGSMMTRGWVVAPFELSLRIGLFIREDGEVYAGKDVYQGFSRVNGRTVDLVHMADLFALFLSSPAERNRPYSPQPWRGFTLEFKQNVRGYGLAVGTLSFGFGLAWHVLWIVTAICALAISGVFLAPTKKIEYWER